MNVVILLAAVLVLVAATIAVVLAAYRRKARRAGYASLGDYLRAVPRSEKEKRDAVDLGLQGLVLCILGLVLPPLLLIGVFPFYYGARKMILSSMGFGLFEDPDVPSV